MKGIKFSGRFTKSLHGEIKMRIKKSLILVGLIIIIGLLCMYFINMSQKEKSHSITPVEAIVMVAKKYDLEKASLEYKGIDEKTNFYIINLSPGNSSGAAGRTFYLDPMTSEIKE